MLFIFLRLTQNILLKVDRIVGSEPFCLFTNREHFLKYLNELSVYSNTSCLLWEKSRGIQAQELLSRSDAHRRLNYRSVLNTLQSGSPCEQMENEVSFLRLIVQSLSSNHPFCQLCDESTHRVTLPSTLLEPNFLPYTALWFSGP